MDSTLDRKYYIGQYSDLRNKEIKISIILVLHNNLEWFNYFENKYNERKI